MPAKVHHNETQATQQTLNSATVIELELPDRIMHPYLYAEEDVNNR